MSFNPILLSKKIEKEVINARLRIYKGFRLEAFWGQSATARSWGCFLKCPFCWINKNLSGAKGGKFYSPDEVYEKLKEISSNEYGDWIMTRYIRITGCEPTIGQEHLLGVLDLCAKNNKPEFLLETNGILLDDKYILALKEFKKILLVRLSFKAGTPSAFEKKTGVKKEFFELPFEALRLLKRHGIQYKLGSMSRDPALMPPAERRELLIRLAKAGVKDFDLLEEEKPDLFGLTRRRLENYLGENHSHSVGKFIYAESLFVTLLRELAIQRGFNGLEDEELLKQHEGLLSLAGGLEGLEKKDLIQFIRTAEFKIQNSPCATCREKNPWHGHGVYDDLDEEHLGKFIH